MNLQHYCPVPDARHRGGHKPNPISAAIPTCRGEIHDSGTHLAPWGTITDANKAPGHTNKNTSRDDGTYIGNARTRKAVRLVWGIETGFGYSEANPKP